MVLTIHLMVMSQLSGISGGSGLGRSIPPVGPVQPVPLLSQAEWVESLRSVNGKHSIEVVNLMLE